MAVNKTTAAVAARQARQARESPPKTRQLTHLEAFRSARFKSMLTPLLFLNILALPLLIPRGPGNTAPPDVLMMPFTALGAAALWRTRTRVRFPLGAFYLMVVFGGILATTASLVTKRSAMAIIQDGYLFVWFIVALNFMRDGTGKAARFVAKTWVLVGVAIALMMCLIRFGATTRIPYLFGYPLESAFRRVSGTFEDPNLAGNYLVISLFVMWASPWPRSRKMKWALTVPFLVGIYTTDSITAIVTVLAGATAAIMTSYISRREVGIAAGLALAGAFLFALTFIPSDITSSSGGLASLGKSGPLAGSVGRTDQSLTPRLERIEEALRYFGSDIIVGIGPSATEATLAAARAPIRGEIHNDYVAGFIERGVVGGLGVLGVFFGAFWWSTRTGSDASLRRAGWRPAALTGATLAVLMAGFSLETLHFRHVWALFALTIALGLGTGETKAVPDGTGPAPELSAGPEEGVPA
jgi:hypothetical protein